MNINDKIEEEIKEDKNGLNNSHNLLNTEIFNKIQTKRNRLLLKKNIIIKLSNKLINTEIKVIDDNYDDLNILQIINILNYLDKSFSNDYFIPNNNNPSDIYYQKEFNIIKNIYKKINKDYNIILNENLETLYHNFAHFSHMQEDSNSQKKNNSYSYYYINEILYDFIIMILILNKTDSSNKDIKNLSPVDKIFLCETNQEQKIICNILSNYLNMQIISEKSDIPQELKSIYHMISLYTEIDNLKQKINSLKNEEKEAIHQKEENNFNQLSEQDYCNIISKKDFIISQLEAKIENMNRNTNTNNTNNENTFRDLEEENEMNKKEIEDMKRMYDVEFELMASAVYGLGINLFFNKEQQYNEQIVNNSSWLTRQKDYITNLKE